MLTKHATIRLELPHEPGEWVEVYPLSGRRLREARKAREEAAMQVAMKQVSVLGADLMAAVQATRTNQATTETAPAAVEDYDADTILRSSIAAWSYDEPVTDENVDDLDSVTQNYIVQELLKPTIERSKQEQLDRFLTSTAP